MVSAMNTGRLHKRKETGVTRRSQHLKKLEASASKRAKRVGDLATSTRTKNQKPSDLTTLAKLEIAFPEGPLRTAAAAAHVLGCAPGVVSYTRKGMAQLLLTDHASRTAAATRALEADPADYLIAKTKWDETKQIQSAIFKPFHRKGPLAIEDQWWAL
jgi:hypothetical protein